MHLEVKRGDYSYIVATAPGEASIGKRRAGPSIYISMGPVSQV